LCPNILIFKYVTERKKFIKVVFITRTLGQNSLTRIRQVVTLPYRVSDRNVEHVCTDNGKVR